MIFHALPVLLGWPPKQNIFSPPGLKSAWSELEFDVISLWGNFWGDHHRLAMFAFWPIQHHKIYTVDVCAFEERLTGLELQSCKIGIKVSMEVYGIHGEVRQCPLSLVHLFLNRAYMRYKIYVFAFHACTRTTKKTLTSFMNVWCCRLGKLGRIFCNFPHGHFGAGFVPRTRRTREIEATISHKSSCLTGSVSRVCRLPAGSMILFGTSFITSCWGSFGTSGFSTHSSSTTTARCDPSWAVMRLTAFPGKGWLSCAGIEDLVFVHIACKDCPPNCLTTTELLLPFSLQVGQLHEECTISKRRFLNCTKSWPYHPLFSFNKNIISKITNQRLRGTANPSKSPSFRLSHLIVLSCDGNCCSSLGGCCWRIRIWSQ